MKFILERSEYKKPHNILILHGYKGHVHNDWVDYLDEYGIRANSLKIDYDKPNVIEDIEEIFKKSHFDYVIGHSLGGLVAIHLSKKFKVRSLVFNVAATEHWFKYLGNERFEKGCCTDLVEAIVCSGDPDIPSNKQIGFLDLIGAKYHTIDVNKHDIVKWVFIRAISKIFNLY